VTADQLEAFATPIPVVHRELLDANLAGWAEVITSHGVELRPHAKTHKTIEVARLQLHHRAKGLTVARPSEGLALLPSGVTDVFVAYTVVGAVQVAQLMELAQQVRVSACIDDLGAATALSAASRRAGVVLDVLVDVDTGLGRTGLPAEQAIELGVAAADLPGLAVRGVFSYAGYPARRRDDAARRAWAHKEAATSVAVADSLRGRGLAIDTVSVAGTTTARFAAEVDGVTEVRPGIYAFGDANTSRLGAMRLEDCALRILATVVSRPTPDRAVLDAGTKALAADTSVDGGTYGHLPAYPDTRLTRLWEEHGVLELSPDHEDGERLQVGDRVEIVPNHVCPAVHLASRLLCLEAGEVADVWEVLAR
jgi:D-serine deaminase-like pyridoxal phosphate-dependent protein